MAALTARSTRPPEDKPAEHYAGDRPMFDAIPRPTGPPPSELELLARRFDAIGEPTLARLQRDIDAQL